jgi:DNA-binding response OmpR family regulator
LCAYEKCVEQESLVAVVANGGIEVLRILEENKDTCSLIILDIMMPALDSFQVLQQIRLTSHVPVLMLTAKSEEEDKVSGLRMGADDYLTKPFSINELMARVNSLIRRYTLLNPVSSSETDRMTFQGDDD